MDKDSTDIESLFISLEAYEQDRAILGDEAVDPFIAQIQEKIFACSPEAPSDEQLEVVNRWEASVARAQDIGLDIAEPPSLVSEAISVVNSYTSFMARIGSTSIVGATQEAEVAEATKVDQPVEELIEPERDTNDDKEIVMMCGEESIKIPAARKHIYVKLFQALASSEDGSVETTSILRELTGGLSSHEIRLITSGARDPLPGVDTKEAKRTSDRFYKVIKDLRERGVISHERGTVSGASAKNRFNTSKPGIIRSYGPIVFSEADDALKIAVGVKPYQVTINLYEQTIDNGRSRKEKFDVEQETFLRINKALGAIALSSEEKHPRFTRSDIAEWTADPDSESPTTQKEILAQTTQDLIKTVDKFDRDFPLLNHGIKGGAYFSWESSASVVDIDGWPNKPRFDEAIVVSIADDKITVIIDDQEHVLLNISALAGAALDKLGGDKDTLIDKYKSLLLALSCMGEKDSMSVTNIYELLYENDSSAPTHIAFSNWFRSFTNKLNTSSDEEQINWKRRGSSVFVDINRRIIVEEDGIKLVENPGQVVPTEEEPSVVNNPHEDEHSELEDVQEQYPEAIAGEDTDGPVRPRKTPEEVAQAIKSLDSKITTSISGRLLHSGKFVYPNDLAEAAYLLQLMSNSEFIAEVRESNGQFRRDESAYKDFVAEVLYACYVRTLSWGSFEDLSAAISEISNKENTNNLVQAHLRSFERTASEAIRSAHSFTDKTQEAEENRNFVSMALDSLVAGSIPKPQNSIQAINLLDIFKKNRHLIAEGRTQAEFNSLTIAMHRSVEAVLGRGNTYVARDSRQSKPTPHHGGAVQVTTGEEPQLGRTDSRRHQDGNRDQHGKGEGTNGSKSRKNTHRKSRSGKI